MVCVVPGPVRFGQSAQYCGQANQRTLRPLWLEVGNVARQVVVARESFKSLVEVLADWPALRTVIVEGIKGARDLGDASTSVVGQVVGDVPITEATHQAGFAWTQDFAEPT